MSAEWNESWPYFESRGEPQDGNWVAKRKLAEALRQLLRQCVATEAPSEVVQEVTADILKAVQKLDAHPEITFQEALQKDGGMENLPLLADRGPFLGLANPMAPPIRIRNEGERAIATMTDGTAYEGPPGSVHGGFIAGAFDQVMGFACITRVSLAVTGSLFVEFQKPTPLATELRMEAYVTRIEGRRCYVAGEVHANGEITATAEGIFIGLEEGYFEEIEPHSEQ